MPTKSTIARTLILIVALVNQIGVSTGHSTLAIDDETITQAVSLIFTIAASIVCWWKNNSFTDPAIKADELMKELKHGKDSR